MLFKLLKGMKNMKKEERCKLFQMKVLIAAVERGARELKVWQDWRFGAWDVGLLVWVYERINHLFNYPSKMSKICQNEQISWQTIFNLNRKNGRKFAMGFGGMGKDQWRVVGAGGPHSKLIVFFFTLVKIVLVKYSTCEPITSFVMMCVFSFFCTETLRD